MGPSLIFDKSFLQGLTVDEAAILDQLYRCVITPIFFIETLADLGKEPAGGRAPEQIVGGLAERTPIVHSAINAAHWDLAVNSLAGEPLPLDGRPCVPGGIPVRVEGEQGVVFRKSPEAEAFERWQRGRFAEVERLFAKEWRESISSLDLSLIADTFRVRLKKEERPKSLEEARLQAGSLMLTGGANYRSLQLAFGLLNVPQHVIPGLIRVWKAAGARALRDYAPYAAHCVEVDLLFYLAMSNGHISDQRPSNFVDMAYLYYLPFTKIFVSSDKLHRRVAPLFMRQDQLFVWGPDLKADLCLIEAYFAALLESERARGLFLLASSPPKDSQGIVAAHWDRFRPGWRDRIEIPPPPKDSPLHAKLLASSNAMIGAAEAGRRVRPTRGTPDRLMIQRYIPKSRGKWRMFSAEVEAANEAE